MKHATLLAALLVALPALADYPLGHHEHLYQTGSAQVPAQGWDPSFSSAHQADKDRMTAAVATYRVGLPGMLEPGDLTDIGCPASTTIDGPEDVVGLPMVWLSGVGDVPLIFDCNRSSDVLKVCNGERVAVYASAFRKVDYVGCDTSGSRIFMVDSLVNAGPDENAAILCAQAECNLMHSEVLGGNDAIKGANGGLYTLGVHAHGMDRTGDEHIDGIQMSPGADDVILINSNIEGPPRTSNAPWFAATDTVLGSLIFADGILTGGTNPFKLGAKAGHYVREPVMLDSRVLGDQQNVSWGGSSQNQLPPCYLGNSSGRFQGEGNRASDGTTRGTENLLGRAWSMDSCNPPGGVSQSIKDRVAAKRKQLETWRDEIRAAVGVEPQPPVDPEPIPEPTPEPEPEPAPAPDPLVIFIEGGVYRCEEVTSTPLGPTS